jgi:hypothetical protein
VDGPAGRAGVDGFQQQSVGQYSELVPQVSHVLIEWRQPTATAATTQSARGRRRRCLRAGGRSHPGSSIVRAAWRSLRGEHVGPANPPCNVPVSAACNKLRAATPADWLPQPPARLVNTGWGVPTGRALR